MERPDSLPEDPSVSAAAADIHLHNPLPVLPHPLHHHLQHQLQHAQLHGIPPAGSAMPPKTDEVLASAEAALQDAKMSPSVSREAADPDNQERWGVAETRAFLQGYNDLIGEFRTTKRNRPVWEKLAQRMTAKGYKRTYEQCRNRWKVLSKSFKAAKESYIAGQGRRNFEFYSEMDALVKASARAGLMDPDDALPTTPPPGSSSTAATPSTSGRISAPSSVNGTRYPPVIADDDEDDDDDERRQRQPRSTGGLSAPVTPAAERTPSSGKRPFDDVGTADSGRKTARTAAPLTAATPAGDDTSATRATSELLLQVRESLAERRVAEAEIKAMMAELIQVNKQLLEALRQKTH